MRLHDALARCACTMRVRLACWQSVKLDEETNECIAKLEAKLKEFLPDVNWDEVKRETVKIEPGAW